MLLLDVPPEVFQRIVKIYVTTVSARQAAKAREVSRTFLDYINEELFARQSTSKFKAREAKKLLEKNLALFLSYRTKSLNGASDFLPLLIHATVDKLMDFAGSLEIAPRDALIEAVTQIIIQRCPHPVNLAIAPTQLQLRDREDDRANHIALGIALHVQHESLVAAILRTGVDPWGQSNLFGYGVYIATDMNNLPLVAMLLSATDLYDAGEVSESRKKIQSRVITNSLNRAVRKGSWAVAVALLTWDSKHFTKSPLRVVGFWITWAVAADGLDFLDKLHKLGYLQHKISNYADYILHGLLKNAQPEPVLRFCIKEGLLYEHDDFVYHRGGTIERQHLLNLAVYKHNLPLAKAALAVNAYADPSAALRAAIGTGNASMVHLLLDNGFDPEATVHPPIEKSTCELAKFQSEIYYDLHRAICKKMKLLGTKYRPPHHVVRASEKEKGIYVPYTFHAPKL